MNTDTPETDHLEKNLGNAAHPVLSYFCRKLERERDELKALLTKKQGTVTISRNGYVQEIERERDEARDQRDRLATALVNCREDSSELLAKRDWWENEPYLDYKTRYQANRDNIDRATAALQSLTLNAFVGHVPNNYEHTNKLRGVASHELFCILD